MPTVAILGGGVGGMSAAHELCTRGFDVHVYEQRTEPGGKARSFGVPGSGTGGRDDLPAEHGFRFFPEFYWHLPETMKEIPVDHGRWVYNNLVHGSLMQVARAGAQSEIVIPLSFPRSRSDLYRSISFLFAYADKLPITPEDLWHFCKRLVVLMSSSEERMVGEWEYMSWWEFSEAEGRSPEYQKWLADGMTRMMVAAKAREMSARTGGSIVLQLLYGLSRPGGHFDSLLNGPTSDVWITPWREHLESQGVKFHLNATVTGFTCRRGKIARVKIKQDGARRTVQADYFVAALPVDKMSKLVSATMKRIDPALRRLADLKVAWMNGVQFYLRKDVRIVHGHSLYSDSPWALSSVSQQQFWRQRLAEMGDGTVNGVISVDVSDWESAGSYGEPAKRCTADQVKQEVWRQLKDHLNDDPVDESLKDNNLWSAVVDQSINFAAPGKTTNEEPLLINTKGSWDDRPEADTKIKNLFLASDYVRTNTDLATMEGANEAARRAANGILKAEGIDDRCIVHKLWQPPFFQVARMLDGWRYDRGEPQHVDQLDPAMPADFLQRPDLALGRFERDVNNPAGIPTPPGWPDDPPPLLPRRPGGPRPIDPLVRRPGDPPTPPWVRVPRQPPGR
jgi:uncharacterized protein with NAD-binding domain and iron-sulfur cluster